MNTLAQLERHHIHQLEEESGIAHQVIAERGVRTIHRGRDLPEGFSWRQKRRGSGILFTVHRPNSETSWSFRPDDPDPDDPGRKYEQPPKCYGGPGNVLDIHPSLHHLIADTNVPVIFVEGIKKADAITSVARAAGVEVLVVGITGVWNWMADKAPIPDMFDIPVEGRKVTIGFDSDKLYNPDVQDAERRLAEHLKDRGAEVWSIYLPNKPDGSKMGADDFFAAGGSLSELQMLTRRYDPADVVSVRLSRDERLQLALEDLQRIFWSFEWKGMGGHSARDVFKVALDQAAKNGKPHKDGVRITIAQRRWARLAKVSTRTLPKALDRLEEWGLGYRDNEGRKPDKAGAFVLRATVRQYGGTGTPERNATAPLQTFHEGVLHLRAPRLRWSSPGRKARRGMVKGTRRIRQGRSLMEDVPPVRRLGKIRGAVLDTLDVAGGSAAVVEICEVLHRSRPRDLRRRVLPKLEEAGIITVENDMVSLTENWLEALEVARELGGEIDAERRDEARHRRQSEAFRRRHETRADEAPAEGKMRAHRESYAERRRRAIEQAIARLFAERPEYRSRRVGQIVCALKMPLDFPRGPDGWPKDAEVEAILNGVAA
jgi:hypothetical protein